MSTTPVVVTSTATLIYAPTAQAKPTAVRLACVSGGPIYIGQSGVESSTGMCMNPGDVASLASPNVALYAVSAASGTLDVSVY